MELIAKDTMRITAATPSRLNAGDRFEINDAEGAALVARGLAALAVADGAAPAPKPAAKPAAKPRSKPAAK